MYINKNIYYVLLNAGVIFIYWRNYCSIIQIKTYYYNSKVKNVLDFVSINGNNYINNSDNGKCRKEEKKNRFLLYDAILNIIPYENNRKIVEGLLELQYCLTNFNFLEKSQFDKFSFTDLPSNNNKQLKIISNTIANEFERQTDIQAKERYLLITLSNLKDNNAITFSNTMFQEINKTDFKKEEKNYIKLLSSMFHSLSEHSDIIKSIKKGHYIMNVADTVKIQLITHINKMIFMIKDSQNKSEFFINNILMEISYIFGLITNYFYFVLWAVYFLGVWVVMLIRMIYKLEFHDIIRAFHRKNIDIGF